MKRKNKKSQRRIYILCDFSTMNINSSWVGSYILWLYETQKFSHIGYKFINEGNGPRVVLFTISENKRMRQYFIDRSSAMIEEECRSCDHSVGFRLNKWNDNFEEVLPLDNDNNTNVTPKRYYISESGSSGREFDNLNEFINAVIELASTYEEQGKDWFEIEVVDT